MYGLDSSNALLVFKPAIFIFNVDTCGDDRRDVNGHRCQFPNRFIVDRNRPDSIGRLVHLLREGIHIQAGAVAFSGQTYTCS